jgi:MipA family protein
VRARAGLAIAVATAAIAASATAQEVRRPLLEAGVFGGGALLPDYPAAGQSHFRALALPWLIYRGDVLRSDDRGLRGRFYRGEDLEFTLNFNGALGTRSSDNRAREGMPDLDYLGEVGPSLRWVAWRDAENRSRIAVEAPVRAVFGTDFERIRYRGLVFAPEVAYERRGLLFAESRARAGIGPVFASGRLMDYWYKVGSEHARPGRPAYDASGGYLGLRLQVSYRVPVTGRLSATLGGRLETFSGATNRESPLFRSELNATLVGGLSFALYRSDAAVASAAEPFD